MHLNSPFCQRSNAFRSIKQRESTHSRQISLLGHIAPGTHLASNQQRNMQMEQVSEEQGADRKWVFSEKRPCIGRWLQQFKGIILWACIQKVRTEADWWRDQIAGVCTSQACKHHGHKVWSGTRFGIRERLTLWLTALFQMETDLRLESSLWIGNKRYRAVLTGWHLKWTEADKKNGDKKTGKCSCISLTSVS